jgi:hypothetical protein
LRLFILEKTGRLLTVHSVIRVLRNVFYTGQLNYHAEVLRGVHQPLITNAVFQAVQKTLDVRGHGGGFGRSMRVYELSGILLCDCGEPMIGHTSTNRGGKYQYFTYYHDIPITGQIHKGYTLNAAKADAMANQLLNRPIRQDWQARIAEVVQQKTPALADDHSDEKLARAQELYVAGDISRDQYRAIREKVTAKTEPAIDMIDVAALMAVLKRPAEAWEQAQPRERWARNKLLLKSIRMTKDEIVDYELTELARAVFE